MGLIVTETNGGGGRGGGAGGGRQPCGLFEESEEHEARSYPRDEKVQKL